MRTEIFALFVGMVYISAGLLGLNPAALVPPPADAPAVKVGLLYGYLLGLFPVNLPHSLLHLAIGAWGLVAWRRVATARLFARTLAVFYAVLAVLGLVPALNTLFGLLPIHGHDVWLHAVTAGIAVYFGWRPEEERRAVPMTDRRDEALPVEQDRRRGHPDRRLPSASASEDL
jgi:hypothetical protein